MYTVGIHDGHNASVALFENNELIFALQEERITREKNASGFPKEAFKYMMEYQGITDQEIDQYVLANNHMIIEEGVSTREKVLERRSESISFKRAVKDILRETPLYRFWSRRLKKKKIEQCKSNGIDPDKLTIIEHHTTHANNAYYMSPFKKEDRVLVITADGGGDKISATVNIAEDGKLRRVNEVPDTASLGYLYAAVTWYMGMVPNEHEYKLMGMAPYAKDDYIEPVIEKLKGVLQFTDEDSLVWKNVLGKSTFRLGKYLDKNFKRTRFDLLCGGIQTFTEELLTELVERNLRHYEADKICLSGGVFMNVKANQRISELKEVEDIFIMPSCGDETNSIGAALEYLVENKNADKESIKPLDGNFCFGPSIKEDDLEKNLKEYEEKYHIKKCPDIEKEVATLLSDNNIVARVKGKMEFGARALGHRSILANPSSYENVRVINEMIKQRDFWMPFAGSFLDEVCDNYIKNPKDIDAPYMIITFDTHKNKWKDIQGAIQQYDKTSRPQVVSRDYDPEYWKLIQYFYEKTGIGCVLNTSFNLHGHPLVANTQDAMFVMKNSGLQYLAIEDYLLEKK